jgi:hypothetical protein
MKLIFSGYVTLVDALNKRNIFDTYLMFGVNSRKNTSNRKDSVVQQPISDGRVCLTLRVIHVHGLYLVRQIVARQSRGANLGPQRTEDHVAPVTLGRNSFRYLKATNGSLVRQL